MRIRLMLVAVFIGFLALSNAAFATNVLITINKVSQKMTVKVDGEITMFTRIDGARG
jgi:hypothetical protein